MHFSQFPFFFFFFFFSIVKRGNFKATSTTIGVRSQLSLLSSIVKAVDPKLHEHIGMIFHLS